MAVSIISVTYCHRLMRSYTIPFLRARMSEYLIYGKIIIDDIRLSTGQIVFNVLGGGGPQAHLELGYGTTQSDC